MPSPTRSTPPSWLARTDIGRTGRHAYHRWVPQLASHIRNQPESGIRIVTERAWATPGAIILSVGEPNFPLPSHVTDAAVAAWRRGDVRYQANSGIAALKDAIVETYPTTYGAQVDASRVMVTAGAVQGFHLALSMILEAGDEILIPDPGYALFEMAPHLLQARPVRYHLTPERDFVPEVSELEALVGPRTRAILVNTPSNPLGSVIPGAALADIYEFARRHDLWIVSDECYSAFVFDGERHVSPVTMDVDHRVFAVYSFSKTYGMTGVRLGYLVCPPGISNKLNAVQESIVSCINPPAQWAGVAALTGPQDSVQTARDFYAEAALEASREMERRGFRFHRPQGAFYLWLDVSHASGSDVASWTLRLLEQRKVAVAPGSAFGPSGEGWVRISLAGDRAQLMEGLSRIPAPTDAVEAAGRAERLRTA